MKNNTLTENKAEFIYDCMINSLAEDLPLPFPASEIPNVFASAECDQLQKVIYNAECNLETKLGFDKDVETITSAFWDLCRILACQMYRYGSTFADPDGQITIKG